MRRPGKASRDWRSSSKPALTFLLLVLTIGSTKAMAVDAGLPLSRLVPARGVYCYLEYEGLEAHTDAWQATAAFEMLGRTAAGAIMSDVTRQVLDRMMKEVPNAKVNGADLAALSGSIVHHGAACAFYDEAGVTSCVMVLKAFGGRDNREHFERLRRFLLHVNDGDKDPAPTQVRGRALFKLGYENAARPTPGINGENAPARGVRVGTAAVSSMPTLLTWWFEVNDLIVVWGPNDAFPDNQGKDLGAIHAAQVASVLDAIEGKQLCVSSHPTYIAASAEGRDINGFEPNGLAFAEAGEGRRGIIDLILSPIHIARGDSGEQMVLETLGLDRARKVLARWGFRGKSLLTDVRFVASEPWQGAGGLLDRPGFHKDRVPPIPRGMGAFAIGTFRGGDVSRAFAPIRRVLSPESRAIFDAAEKAVSDASSPQLREDLFRQLGPTWCVYAAPPPNKDATATAVPTFLIEIGNADALEKVLETLVSRFNAYFRDQGAGKEGRQGDANDAPVMAFERLPAPDRGYRLTAPASLVSWLGADVQPTLMLGKSFVVAAATPELARAALAAETRNAERWAPDGELLKSFDCLPERLSFLNVGNPRDSCWPEAIASFTETAEPFLRKFVGLDGAAVHEVAPPTDLLTALGIPKRAGSGVRIERAKMPKADEIRAHLFPSVVAATVDEHDFRFLSLEAVPFACVGLEVKFEIGGKVTFVGKNGSGK